MPSTGAGVPGVSSACGFCLATLRSRLSSCFLFFATSLMRFPWLERCLAKRPPRTNIQDSQTIQTAVLSPPTDQHLRARLYHKMAQYSSPEFELPSSLGKPGLGKGPAATCPTEFGANGPERILRPTAMLNKGQPRACLDWPILAFGMALLV